MRFLPRKTQVFLNWLNSISSCKAPKVVSIVKISASNIVPWTTYLTEHPREPPSEFCWFWPLLYENPLIQKCERIFMVPTVYISLLLWTTLDGAMLIKYIVDAIKIIVMNFIGCRIVFIHKRDERIMERERSGRHFLNNCLLNMASRNDLTLEQTVNLI